jgi:membrane-bound metal-dependent hydrolase YbcI (DUF457 family)
MDILHHTAIGVAGGIVMVEAGQPLAGLAFLVASILPDSDVMTMARGKVAYLLAHQGLSHSLLFGGLGALLCAAIVGFQVDVMAGLIVGMAFAAGFFGHVLLDMTNTLGPRILWPSPKRYRLDAVFFIDALSWALIALTFWGMLKYDATPVFGVYVICMVTQIMIRISLSQRAREQTGYPIAIPDPFIPWLFHLTKWRDDGGVDTTSWSLVRGEITASSRQLAAPSVEAVRIASAQPIVQAMDGFSRALSVWRESTDAEGNTIVVLRDAAMRRVGADFGEITLTRKPDGKVDYTIKL